MDWKAMWMINKQVDRQNWKEPTVAPQVSFYFVTGDCMYVLTIQWHSRSSTFAQIEMLRMDITALWPKLSLSFRRYSTASANLKTTRPQFKSSHHHRSRDPFVFRRQTYSWGTLLPVSENRVIPASVVLSQYTCVTDKLSTCMTIAKRCIAAAGEKRPQSTNWKHIMIENDSF